MRRDIRNEILQTAKELFNERGFNAVSTRDIAQVLGISKGNLTYHFKKKEEIMEAILLASQDSPRPTAPTTLAELDALFLRMQQMVRENAFYFWHHAQIAQLSPKIRELQHRIYVSNVEIFTQALQALLAEGMIRKENQTGEYDRIIDTLLLSIVYWMPFCELKQVKATEANFQKQAWTMLYPVLTDKGRRNLREIEPML